MHASSRLRFLTVVSLGCIFACSASHIHADPPGGDDPFAPQQEQKPSGAVDDPFGEPPRETADEAPRQAGGDDPRFEAAKSQPVEPTAPQVNAAREREERLRRILGEPVSFQFPGIPLADALRQIEDEKEIPIVLDRRWIEDLGLTAEVPVNISLDNVSLRSFLQHMLRELELDFTIHSETLLVTTAAQVVGRYRTPRLYQVPPALHDEMESVAEAVRASIRPEIWSPVLAGSHPAASPYSAAPPPVGSNHPSAGSYPAARPAPAAVPQPRGGRCTISVLDGVLVIAAPENVHFEVERFMERLRNTYP